MPQTETKCLVNSQNYFNIVFKKYDSRDFSNLLNAQFKLTSTDGTYTFASRQEYDEYDNFYNINSNNSNLNYDELFNLLPNNIKEIVSSINTLDDYNTVMNTYDLRFNQIDTNNSGTYDNRDCYHMSFTYPVLLKEVMSPPGYQKQDTIVLSEVEFTFTFDENNNIKAKGIDIHGYRNGYFYYDSNLNLNSNINTYDYYVEYLHTNAEALNIGCGDTYPYSPSNIFEVCSDSYTVIEDDIGEVVLTIDNTVNDKHEYTTNGNSRVEYKVIVSNNGNASSGNNIVKTVIPKEIEVLTNTISDDGVYTNNDRTITWNIDYIDPHSNEELTYSVNVPSNKIGKYTITSNVNSNQQLDIVESAPAVLNIVSNPTTGNIFFLIMIGLFVLLCVVLVSLNRKIKTINGKI